MKKKDGYQRIISIINEISAAGERRKLGMLYTEDEVLDGRTIQIHGKNLLNFGSCGYLGLEQDERLKEAAIDAVKRFGTYFSSSRTYASCGNYQDLEEVMGEMFGTNILLTTNLSLGHHVVMPIVVESNDLVIYDQQAHVSMHELSYKLKHFGTDVTVLRHNRLDELEAKIEEFNGKYDKIWYMVDGVFSMFGDLPKTKKLEELLNKHKKFYLYVDDAHGMSWAGPNGTGYTLSQMELHSKMILATSFAKGFGSCGGVFAIKDYDLYQRIRRWGGPLTYSGPQEPATVAAAVASAKIHLSDEIKELQNKLLEKIRYCNKVMQEHNIPLVSVNESPIFFVGLGITKMAFSMAERLIQEGFYTNVGAFPAVPETCSGVRFTITNHLTFEDINNLAINIAKHLPKAMAEEERTIKHIFRAFKKFSDMEQRIGDAYQNIVVNDQETLKLESFGSIREMDKEQWNDYLGDRGSFDYDNMLMLEETFSNNEKPQDNWEFFYYRVKDGKGTTVLQTFFTAAITKDDMIAPKEVSALVEAKRKDDPLYLTSKYFMMGSLVTNGNHLYLNSEHPEWKRAMVKLIDKAWQMQDETQSNVLYFRDFETDHQEMNELFLEYGFVKIDLPENHIIRNDQQKSIDEFLVNLNKKKRQYFKKDVLLLEDEYTADFSATTEEELPEVYQLYLNVQQSNLGLNTFPIPFKFFQNMIKSNVWQIMKLRTVKDNKLVAIVCGSVSEKSFSPVLAGMDYDVPEELHLYKQLLYQLIKRGLDLKLDNIFFGVTATISKRKMGIEAIPQIGFIQIKDHYNMDYIESLKFD